MTEDLVLGVQEMDISRGNNHLPQGLAQANHGTVVFPQLLHILGDSLGEHKHIVCQGLNFQIVIERGNAQELVLALAVQNGLEQLARLTGRADDQALPQLQQLGFRDAGHPLEIFQIGIGNQVIQVAKANLILGQNDDMPCVPVRDAALGPQGRHTAVDLLEGMDVQFLFHPGHEPVHDEAAGNGIVRSPVVIEVRQAQGIGHDIQLEFVQLGQHILREDQGIRCRIGIGQPLSGARGPDKAGVKIRIVGNQNSSVHKFQEFRQDLFDFRCTLQHLIRNTGELHDLLFQGTLGVYKGLEPVQLFAVLHDNGADLYDPVICRAQARGFQVEGHILVAKANILLSVDHNTVIHIINIVPFYTVEDLDVLVGSGNLCLGGGLHGIREGLCHAVVRNGNGLVAPGRSLLDGGCGIGQSIHITHGGVQMELYPLAVGRRILPLGQNAGHHGIGLEDHIVFKPVLDQFALNPKDAAELHIIQNGLGLLGLQEAGDTDGIGVVRHVELHYPGIALGQLLVLNGKNLALHDDGTHIQIQVLHGHSRTAEGLSVEGIAVLGLPLLLLRLFCTGCGGCAQGLLPELFHDPGQFRSGQVVVGLYGNGDFRSEPLLQRPDNSRNLGLYPSFAVGNQADCQVSSIPRPLSPGQGGPGHGVEVNEQIPQLLGLDFGKLCGRVGQGNFQIPQTVQGENVFLRLPGQSPGYVGIRVGGHLYAAVFRPYIHCHKGRLRKGLADLLRRLVVREHIQ